MALTVLDRFYMLDESFFAFSIKYLFFVGLWPAKSLTKIQKILYKFYAYFLHIVTLAFVVMISIGAYQERDDVIVLLSNLDKSFAMYNFFCKTVTFMLKRDHLMDLIDEIEQSGDEVTEERKKLMAKCVVMVTVLSCGVLGTFSVLAVFEGEMSVEAWMAFNPKESMMNLILAVQIVAVMAFPLLCRAFAMQGLVCSLIMYLCDQLILLQTEIRDLEFSKKMEMATRIKFKKIVKKHVRFMGYSKKMEIIFKEYFLIQNLAITVELCLNAVMMSIVGVKQMTLLITFLVYLLIALTNAYIYCYLGNELIIQSQAIALAAYESSWTSWPVDMQKNLLILISVAQRPLKLSAGGIALLSIQTFSQALYNGYSIFAVLNDAVN